MLAAFAVLLLAGVQSAAGSSLQSKASVRDGSSRGALLEDRDLGERVTTLHALRGGGQTLSRLLPILLGKQQCRILMIGLDAAGKTTILYQLKLGEMANTSPTLGFNVETVAYKNIEFMVWDMGGQDAIRPLWRHYYENAQALIFVVDSADEERLEEAREELSKLMGEEQLKDAVLLVYANKQDLPEAKSVQVSSGSIANRPRSRTTTPSLRAGCGAVRPRARPRLPPVFNCACSMFNARAPPPPIARLRALPPPIARLADRRPHAPGLAGRGGRPRAHDHPQPRVVHSGLQCQQRRRDPRRARLARWQARL